MQTKSITPRSLTFFYLFIFSSVTCLKAQISIGKSAESLIPGTNKVWIDETNKTVKFAQLKAQSVSTAEHLMWINTHVKPKQEDITLQLYKREADQQGYMHYRYRQYYKGVRVEYGVCYAHSKGESLQSVNGELYPGINLPIVPAFDKKEAFKKALASIPSQKYQYTDASGNPVLQDSIELLVFPTSNTYKLAYKVDVYSMKPLKRAYVYVDALSGAVLYTEDRIHHTDVPGTATTGYNGTVTMTTDQTAPDNYRLRSTKGFGGIATFNMLNDTDYSLAIDFNDVDNIWDATGIEKFAYDAHFGAESTYEYYLTRYGRNSYDNEGASINSYVHYDVGYVNAFWDGTQMTYGDGNSQNTPLTSLDVVGHEITHAVTQHTADLVYNGESGGLNESFSDCFGVAVDYYRNPATANFLMGDQFNALGVPFRNMSDPKEYFNPDTYNGDYWNDPDEVHNNSGVQNYWFYLLSMGGTGINDLNDSYDITAIGIDKAAAVAYRNLSVYLTPNSDYNEACVYAIHAASDLYGSCSNEVIQVTNAWFAVGVGQPFDNSSIADFDAQKYSPCYLPATVQFSNQSINADTFLWTFGDGTSSTDFEPTHVYANAGEYTVQLTASSALCGASGTAVKTNFVLVYDGYSPQPATCSPATINYCCGAGISDFSFGTLNRSSMDGEEGYQDLTCSHMVTVEAGQTVAIDVQSGDGFNEDAMIWIDFDNNGILDSVSELIFESYDIYMFHTGSYQIPDTGVVMNTPLRMRVMTDFEGRMTKNSCKSPRFGQAEDYTIRIIPDTPMPVANFTANKLLVDVGESVSFTDLSINNPTDWEWTFTGGTPSNSSNQNPNVTYNTIGVYPAKLVVSNSFGADSLTKYYYITVMDVNSMCKETQSTSTEGTLYDSGGETGVYKSGENCSFVINPPCVESVTLTFSEFSTEQNNDEIFVYDGNGTLLLQHSGAGLPASVTSNSGGLRVDFESNFGFNLEGFKANWTSVGLQLVTDFSSTQTSDNTVSFTVSEPASDNYTYSWDFGDSQGSSLKNPSHQYSDNNCYNVTLTVANPLAGSCSQVLSHLVCINSGMKPDAVKLYPNPSSGLFWMEIPGNLEEFDIHDAKGRRVSFEIEQTGTYEYLVDIQALQDAAYLIRINGEVYRLLKYTE